VSTFPDSIYLVVSHAGAVPGLTLAGAYARCFDAAGFGGIVGYSVAGMDAKIVAGTQITLEATLRKLGPRKAHFFEMMFDDDTRVTLSRQGDPERWQVWAPSKSETDPDAAWLKKIVAVATTAVKFEGFDFATVSRSRIWQHFTPQPPLARTNHLVTVTEQGVAECYENPAYFWSVWDRIEKIGDQRVCIRALDALDDHAWLARTFEQTMELARLAAPGLTLYEHPGDVDEAFGPWWDEGDIQDEKAGYRALELVGYDADTRTVEYTGLVSRKPLIEGGPEARHVLMREILEIWLLVQGEQLEDGRPVAAVRVVFPEPWMAQQERRPLLDVGAKVFYLDRETGELVEVTT
jgi:hypothetical protein